MTVATRHTKRQPDWPEIRAGYQANTCSIRALARRHGVSHTAIQKRSVAEGWERQPRSDLSPSRAENPAKVGPVSSDPKDAVARGRDLAARLLDELSATTSHLGEVEQAIVDETAGDPDGRRRAALLRAVDLPRRAAVLKDLATVLRTLDAAAPGKKAEAEAAAGRAGSGRYSVPGTPPKLVVNNGPKQ
jgi:hypothetical protein